ncbi:MAG: SDR family NAD(P)-dependent oxidoreductase [Armatimonadota bacterium]
MDRVSKPVDQTEVLRRAYREIQQLRSQLEARERAATEPIAIVGLGCRFPGGIDDAASYWKALETGRDCVGRVPPDRWDADALFDPDLDAPGRICTREGGFLGDVRGFDAEFFGISPREAARMDPQQRLLLEVAWEALEDAGVPVDRLYGSRTGIFVGYAVSDYARLYLRSGAPEQVDSYYSTGTSPSIVAGRLSYLLGLQGPSLVVDTACSSSLVATHLALQSLRQGECELALAGGVNLVLSPELSINFSRARMLSPDGRCKTFDASADGYGRGEGCGVVVLKRLSDAGRDGDRVLALIRGSAVNHDGRSGGLTAPNGRAQVALLRQALRGAGLTPEQVSYLESHGTGTALGDPIELHALAEVFAGRETPLWVGSVKTNLGHLEAAAGVAGLIKTVLALQHRCLPPHLHFGEWNPHIDRRGVPLEIPREPQAWEGRDGRWIAGVSSFGFSGTNAHVLLEAAPEPPVLVAASPEGGHLLCLSAKDAAGLQALASRYERYLAELERNGSAVRLADVCGTAYCGRTHFEARLAVVGATAAELRERLRDWAAGGEPGQCLGAGDARLREAGEAYVRGGEVDPAVFGEAGSWRKAPLPTYPFQRRDFWLPARSGEGSRSPGTLLTRTGASGDRGAVFQGRVSPQELPLLRDSGGLAHVGVHLELVAQSMRELRGDAGCELADVHFSRALVVEPPREVRLTLGNDFRIESRAAESADWQAHVTGRVLKPSCASERIDLERVRARCAAHQTEAELYWRLEQAGFQLGPAARCVESLQRGEGEALAVLRDPGGAEFALGCHPGLVEACAQLGYALLPPGDTGSYMLTHCAELRLGACTALPKWGYARLRSLESGRLTADLALLGPEGEVLIELRGAGFTRLAGAVPPAEPRRVAVEERGRLDTIRLAPFEPREPGPGEVEIEVAAAALTFRDALNALGVLAEEAAGYGSDCAGTVTRIGPGVAGLRPGDRVVAVAEGALTTHVTADAGLVLPIPDALGSGEAAALPIPFLTAWIGLRVLARLQPGERVLIHNAAGGVGLAAVQIARSIGAEVVATAHPDKHAHLRSLGLEQVFPSSPSGLDAGAARPGGFGVILGARSAEGLRADLPSLLPGGRYVQLGKQAVSDSAEVAALRSDASYLPLDLFHVRDTEPEQLRRILEAVLREVADGSLAPLPSQLLPVAQAEEAFRIMARGRNVGRIVLSFEASGRVLAPAPTPEPGERLCDRLHRLSPSEAQAVLADRVRSQVAAVLELDSPGKVGSTTPLRDLGLDSTAAVDLSGRLSRELGLKLPATLAYQLPTVQALSEHLAGELGLRAQALTVEEPDRTRPVDRAEPVAIIGMACRFPAGADTPMAFRELLYRGVDAVTDAPPERFGDAAAALGKGGYLWSVDAFDAAFFGISDSEAAAVDPQQRLLLEVAWEALESAGQLTSDGAPSETGVFLGIGSQSSDYAWLQRASGGTPSLDEIAGNFHSFASGRLAYALNLKGPSMVVDAACASSLAAVHLACASLQAGECRTALAGAVNLILLPHVAQAMANAGLLSPSGACRTFDAAADGFVRGEGCGMLVLKRLSDAVEAGDPVLAVVLGGAVAQGGRGNGLTSPNGRAQAAVIRSALAAANVAPEAVGYVEAHGTGTRLGDAIEVEAVSEVLGGSRKQPLLLGAVKTQLGHCEAAAGMAGLIKAVTAIREGMIPGNLHQSRLNPDLEPLPPALEIPAAPRAWDDPVRIAGVSAFGMNGTNAHLILGPAPSLPEPPGGDGPGVLPISAHSETALRALVTRCVERLREDCDWHDVCYSASVGRRHFEHRLAVVAKDAAGAREALRAYLCGRPAPGVVSSAAPPEESAPGAAGIAYGYVHGQAIDWASHYPAPRRRLSLPSYPFQRQRYWFDHPVPLPADPQDSAAELAHRIEWCPLRLRPGALPPGPWLLISDRKLGPELAAGLRARGAECVLHLPDESGERLPDRLQLGERRNVVYLAALDATPLSNASAASLARERRRLLGGLADLLRAVASAPGSTRLWIVTGGAEDGEALQSSLQGAAAALRAEHPELRCSLIDLDPAAREAGTLLAELLTEEPQERVALRGSERLVPRIVRLPLPPGPSRITADATYLLTGGLGGLGLAAAERLAALGARHLALVTRTEREHPTLHRLREQGVQVRVFGADLADEQAVAGVLAEIRDGMPPLRGIFHAAGALSDGLLARTSAEQIEAVFSGKAEGAWHLHRLTLALELDFFVLYSSATPYLGLPGAGIYAAANAFLDGLARHRHSLGLPALSIGWGAWEGTGMAAADDRRGAQWAAHGLRPFSARQGLAALQGLLQSDLPHALVLAPGWTAENSAAEAASACPPAAELVTVVREVLREVLRLAGDARLDETTPLGELGLDSLGAVELRDALSRRLARELPVTLAFNHPWIAAVVQFLGEQDGGCLPVSRRTDSHSLADDLEQLSEAEAEALLERKLAELDRRPSRGGA